MEVNDSIVDFFLMFAADSVGQDLLSSSHVFSSFFYTKLSSKVKIRKTFVLPSADKRYAGASKFTRKVDIFKKKFLFIPVCRSGHWFLALVYNLPILHVANKRRGNDDSAVAPILMIDSIVYGSDRENFSCDPSPRDQEAELIRGFIRCEWMAKMNVHGSSSSPPNFTSKSMPIVYPKVPQQENGYDCGVFVMLFFEAFVKQKFPIGELLSDKILPWYDQVSAMQLRERITGVLLELGSRY